MNQTKGVPQSHLVHKDREEPGVGKQLSDGHTEREHRDERDDEHQADKRHTLKQFIEAAVCPSVANAGEHDGGAPFGFSAHALRGHQASATTDAQRVGINPINAVYATLGLSYSNKNGGLEAPLSVRLPAL
jgi:hypothetical protein